MKNVILLSAICLGLFCVSCSDQEENKTIKKAKTAQAYYGQSQTHSEHLSTPLELDSLLWSSFGKQGTDIPSKLEEEMATWMKKEKASFNKLISKEASLSTSRQSVLADKNFFSDQFPFSI